MSKFKFKGWILDNYFPRYFKEQDTYKGDDGRGILESFWMYVESILITK